MSDVPPPVLATIRRWQTPGPAQLRFALAAAAGFVLLMTVGPAVYGAAPLPLAAAAVLYGAAAHLAFRAMQACYPFATLGSCNVVTLLRLVLSSMLALPLATGDGAPLAIVAVASVALALDGVDGWLARRDGLSSAFGARFDVEVDALLALVLALLAMRGGHAGAAVLILGLARYAFVAAGAALPWLAAPLPERLSRKAVCVAQLGTLVALQLPAIAAPAAGWLIPAVVAALAWSFGRDILWLWRQR